MIGHTAPCTTSAPRTARHGFTLIEVLVAGAIFVIGTAAVLSSWRSVLVSIEQQRRSADAVAVAEDVLDDLRLRLRDSADLTPGNHTRFFDDDRRDVAVEDAGGYRVDWTVHDSNGETFRRIEVVVGWHGSDQRSHVISFVTFRASG